MRESKFYFFDFEDCRLLLWLLKLTVVEYFFHQFSYKLKRLFQCIHLHFPEVRETHLRGKGQRIIVRSRNSPSVSYLLQ